MSVDMFIQILDCLPNLRSIRVEQFPFLQPIKLSSSSKTIWKKFLKENQIEKFTLRSFDNVRDVINVIVLFPRIKYLALQNLVKENIEIFLRWILLRTSYNRICHLTAICLDLQNDLIEKFKQDLPCNYSIHRQSNRIYLILN